MSTEQNAVLIMNRQPQPILEKYSRDQVRHSTSFCTTATRRTDMFLVSDEKFNRTDLQKRRQMETAHGFKIN